MAFFHFLLLLLLWLANTGKCFHFTNHSDVSREISFSVPLIHRSSPRSPFYNPNVTEAEVIEERVKQSLERAQAWGVSRDSIPVTHEFVLLFSIGTPPVETYALPDTGSDLMWLQCNPCKDCYTQNIPVFNIDESDTYAVVPCYVETCADFTAKPTCDRDNNCVYTLSYLDGSNTFGNIAEDIISVESGNSTDRFSLVFGCGFNNTSAAGPKYPGIFGLANTKRSLLGQMHFSAFSYCHDGFTSGSLQLGRKAAKLWGKSTPFVLNDAGHYLLLLKDIYVNENALQIPRKIFRHVIGAPKMTGVIIDSGTYYTLLPPVAYDKLLSEVNKYMVERGKRMVMFSQFYCWDNPRGNMDPLLPRISFQFHNLRVDVDENAWFRHDLDVCLSFVRNSENFTIYGLEHQRNINMGYDLLNSKLWFQSNYKCWP